MNEETGTHMDEKNGVLSEEEKAEIDAHAAQFLQRQAAGIDALKIAQRSRGWVSDETLRAVAAHLDMTPAELDSVATFYNLIFRRPVGRHVILYCDSVSCWVMGFPALVEHLRQRLDIAPGETTDDGRFTLLPIPCLGNCDHAPAMMVDGELHQDLTPERIDTILESCT